MDSLPLSLLNDYLYCPRRAALKLVEGIRRANVHTIRGDLAHAHVDHPGFEHRGGWRLLRALPLWSDDLGLSGKADLVEVREEDGHIVEASPVEYKKGSRRRFENDDAQLCAQALCLEEMLGITVATGAIYHAESQSRREVPMTPSLREATKRALRELHEIAAQAAVPPAEARPQCEGCSLQEICLPSASPPRLARLARELFHP